ncbi:MAG: DUF1549 domain-containing protein, partial [Planctomycetales bacterium]|nr:DUF1549 domain-containing protein [Planctomycetales bacterium]
MNELPNAIDAVMHRLFAPVEKTGLCGFASTLLLSFIVLFHSNVEADEFPGLGPRGDLVGLEITQTGLSDLVGRNARKQLIVTGHYSSGQSHDLTRDVIYSVDSPQIVRVQKDGLVIPLGDGKVTITARHEGSGKTASAGIIASECGRELPINFKNEIVPIFTKLGCNSGGCHGKADGQNGFRLSLLGFYPDEDYDFLVHEDRGRRIFPSDPEFSLLIQKPANISPHGGGKRIERDSYEWQLLTRWIGQGTPLGSEDDPILDRLEVIPSVREMNFGSAQQLAVLAHYSDGSMRDVTRLASYEANHEEMATCESDGRVTMGKLPGEVAIMVRFGGQVAVFRSIIPQGSAVESTPPENNFIDQLVFARLKLLGIPPSVLCDDQTFIRRVTVDIAGRLPTVEETRQFIADTNQDKRDRLVDRLVDSTGYADYFANKWANVLRNKRRNNNDVPYTYRFHTWIRRSLYENMPYDQFVRNVLTATGESENHPPVAWYREVRTSTAQMEDTAQLFLGMRLACAKCHHHPFERWSQNDYYGFEAFFSQAAMKNSKYNRQTNIPDMVYVKAITPKSRNPRTGLDVPPTPLGGEPLEVPTYEDARHQLVDWMADPQNPFFAKALVNRYWKHFFNRGLIEPEDDIRETNPPTNPELLAALEKHFIESGFDLKELVRVITNSRAYQLSAVPNEVNVADRQNYSRFYPRRLQSEVILDGIDAVTGATTSFANLPPGTKAIALPDNSYNKASAFLRVFGRPDASSVCECERDQTSNLAQSLHLINSSEMKGKLAVGGGRAARFGKPVANSAEDTGAQQTADREHIEELYQAVFARLPDENELATSMAYVQEPLTDANDKPMDLTKSRTQNYQDLIWAL